MPLTLIRDDISRVEADAIVNAANESLKPGGGVCGALFQAAGYEKLLAACESVGHCKTGRAVATPAFNLRASYVIHAVGPVWRGGRAGEEELLRSCYKSALSLAASLRLESVAFPLLSSGIFGYPKDRALSVAVSEIARFLETRDMDVTLVLFDRAACALPRALGLALRRYVDDNYVDAHTSRRIYEAERTLDYDAMPLPASLEDALAGAEEGFARAVLREIDARGYTDVEVYKRANLDRRVFSKLRSESNYQPSRQTAVALAVALRMGPAEASELLERAGYALSPSSRADLVVRYFLEAGRFDIHEINEALFAYGEPCLGV